MRYLLTLFTLLSTVTAEPRWQTEDSTGSGTFRRLLVDNAMVYRHGTGPGVMDASEVSRTHRFYWNGKLALVIDEHDEQEKFYFGSNCTSHPDAGVETHTWDHDRDGVIDVARIGKIGDDGMLFFGRYKDGIFSLAPTDGSFTELWDYLKKHKSEQDVPPKSDRAGG